MLDWNDESPQFVGPEEREFLARQEAYRLEAEEDQAKEDARRRHWEQQFDLWRLTPKERCLFRVLEEYDDERMAEKRVLLKTLYAVPLDRRLRPREEMALMARLRKLQQRLNARLRSAGAPYRVEPRRKVWLRLVGDDLTSPGGDEGDEDDEPLEATTESPLSARELDATLRELRAVLREMGEPMGPWECVETLRALLAAGPVPYQAAWHHLKGGGCRPGTFRRARKRLGVRAERRGFGGDGGWWLELPT
jgi:hypothetical protein